ncbi:6-phosphogluconolactonase DevB-type [Penicillium alfredii]|uniref:6-phosphogluconolactonase n=1 Tax=Penicillium alfredii TaxID=1506179 RepID=A0A9W9KRM9_9EURO|nr:6-phosphogluconolactonase DevB-type [Penicillium alfredii]KAJ5115457.1 6-phosphogluconolactonase DevB-type [Penicillium alfredii]
MATAHPNLFSFPSTDYLAQQLRGYVLRAQNAALTRHDTFRLAVSGGSLPTVLARALLAPSNGSPEDTPQFAKWHIFFADERAVPLDHEDSNYRLLKDELVSKIPSELGAPTVHAIDANHVNDDDPQELADLYQEELMRSFAAKDSVKLPVFDLILLGCGPDGHTCSLFPGHELLREKDAWVAAETNSPKPPPKRITLTLPVVTHAVSIAFVATGAGKKDILKKIFDQEEGRSIPSALVNQGGGEKVSWFTDHPAVEGISFPRRGSL